jgi:hypothetical protein
VRTRTAAVGLLTAPALLLAGATAAAADAPGRLCADGNVFVIEYTATYEGSTPARDGDYERAVPTTGGCASSWAHGDGQLSVAAISAQCRTGIEPRFGPYPITLQFAQPHVLANRADCIRVMSGIAHGEIDPGRAPLFPGGSRQP